MRWEYDFADSNWFKDEEVLLNQRGKKGWELVSVVRFNEDGFNRFYFKRPATAEAGGSDHG